MTKFVLIGLVVAGAALTVGFVIWANELRAELLREYEREELSKHVRSGVTFLRRAAIEPRRFTAREIGAAFDLPEDVIRMLEEEAADRG